MTSSGSAHPRRMKKLSPFRYFKTSPGGVKAKGLEAGKARGIDIYHETVRLWWSGFDPMFAAEIPSKPSADLRRRPPWPEQPDEPPEQRIDSPVNTHKYSCAL